MTLPVVRLCKAADVKSDMIFLLLAVFMTEARREVQWKQLSARTI